MEQGMAGDIISPPSMQLRNFMPPRRRFLRGEKPTNPENAPKEARRRRRRRPYPPGPHWQARVSFSAVPWEGRFQGRVQYVNLQAPPSLSWRNIGACRLAGPPNSRLFAPLPTSACILSAWARIGSCPWRLGWMPIFAAKCQGYAWSLWNL